METRVSYPVEVKTIEMRLAGINAKKEHL